MAGRPHLPITLYSSAQLLSPLCSKIREVAQALKALDARLQHSLAAGTRLSASAAAICGCSTSRRSGRCGRAHRTPSRLKITTLMSTLPAHGSWRSCSSHLRRQRAGCGCSSRLHHTQQRTAAGAAACAAQQEVPGLLPRRLTVGAGAVVPGMLPPAAAAAAVPPLPLPLHPAGRCSGSSCVLVLGHTGAAAHATALAPPTPTPCPSTLPQGHGVPSPPAWLLQALAQRLRRQTGLSLFNFDVIVPMHCHRRCLRHDSSTAGVGTPASSLEQARMQQAGQAGQQAGGVQQNGACRPQQAEQAEEPAALDLRLAEAQAAAAAAAAPAVLHDAAARGGACVGQERRPPSEHAGHAGQGEEGQQQELLYHLIDINYFPGGQQGPGSPPDPVLFTGFGSRRNVCVCLGPAAWKDGSMLGLRAPAQPPRPPRPRFCGFFMLFLWCVQCMRRCPTTKATWCSSCAPSPPRGRQRRRRRRPRPTPSRSKSSSSKRTCRRSRILGCHAWPLDAIDLASLLAL